MKYKIYFTPHENEKNYWLKAWRINKKTANGLIGWILSCISSGYNVVAFREPWKPYCYESKCSETHTTTIPGHGSYCTCQKCGHDHDNCICQYFEEPCLSCGFKTHGTN